MREVREKETVKSKKGYRYEVSPTPPCNKNGDFESRAITVPRTDFCRKSFSASYALYYRCISSIVQKSSDPLNFGKFLLIVNSFVNGSNCILYG